RLDSRPLFCKSNPDSFGPRVIPGEPGLEVLLALEGADWRSSSFRTLFLRRLLRTRFSGALSRSFSRRHCLLHVHACAMIHSLEGEKIMDRGNRLGILRRDHDFAAPRQVLRHVAD